MKTGILTSFVIAGTVLATGCIMPDEMSQMRKEVGDVQLQLLQIRNEQDQALARMREIVENAARAPDQADREELAEINLRLEQMARKMSATDERVTDLQVMLDRTNQEIRQTREMARRGGPISGYAGGATERGLPLGGTSADTEAPGGSTLDRMPAAMPTRGGGSGEPLPDPEALYNTAYADFSKGNYALAISGFEEYRERFSQSPLADNALYWVGECHFSQGNYPSAIEAFDRLLALYPDSDKAAAGNLKKALAYSEQNSVGRAIVQLNYVVSRYPDTDEARIASDKLSSLGGNPN